ncbi:hypothetical protein GF367_04065 [Candidatus Woesearchaeota archaeon]|nr:hypothetical protein [Candidatus Woesearchaeota archaeon]
MTGCGDADEIILGNETNETAENQTNTIGPPKAITEEASPTVAEPEPPVEEAPPPEEEPALPATFNILLNTINIQKPLYGDDEEYELRMILSKEQSQKIVAATLTYTPSCDEPSRMIITANDDLVAKEALVCGEGRVHDLPAMVFVEGPNTVLFRNKVDETYELTDVQIQFTYNDGATETLVAEDHVFEPGDDERKEVKDLAIVSVTNTVTRTFSLSEQQLHDDLYLEFDTVERAGDLLILLNDQVLFQGRPPSRGKTLLLPPETLDVGENELTFIGMTE